MKNLSPEVQAVVDRDVTDHEYFSQGVFFLHTVFGFERVAMAGLFVAKNRLWVIHAFYGAPSYFSVSDYLTGCRLPSAHGRSKRKVEAEARAIIEATIQRVTWEVLPQINTNSTL